MDFLHPDDRQRAVAELVHITHASEVINLRNRSACTSRRGSGAARQRAHARLETLRRLAPAAECRDDDTHQHTKRVGDTCMLIARALGLSDEMIETIGGAAPLHDVGKLGVSDSILLKPGKLTADEYQSMQQHTAMAGRSSRTAVHACCEWQNRSRWRTTSVGTAAATRPVSPARRSR